MTIIRNVFTSLSPDCFGISWGFNISSDINFHQMMGFDEKEVMKLLQKIGTTKANLPIVLSDLREWYDGYLFNVDAKNHVYNPDMVLLFAQFYQQYKKYPDRLTNYMITKKFLDRKGLKGFVFICHGDKLIYREHGGFPKPLEIKSDV